MHLLQANPQPLCLVGQRQERTGGFSPETGREEPRGKRSGFSRLADPKEGEGSFSWLGGRERRSALLIEGPLCSPQAERH